MARSSLRRYALAGRTVLLAGPGSPELASALSALGARVRRRQLGADAGTPGPADDVLDLLLVDLRAVDLREETAVAVAAGVTSAFQCARAAREALVRGPGAVLFLLPGGAIPAVGSTSRGEHPEPGTVRAAQQSAVLSLTRSLAREWAADGVRANCLIVGEDPDHRRLADLTGLLAGPAGAMLTGQILDLRHPPDRMETR